MNFKVGDVVFVIKEDYNVFGRVGFVKLFTEDYVGIQFREPITGGCDLHGNCLDLFGYYLRFNDIQKMEPFSITFKKQWNKEWEPKLRIKDEEKDIIFFIEE